MTLAKRIFDIALSFVLIVILFPVICVISLLLLMVEGRPILYISERMKTPTTAFNLIKFRTMRGAANNNGVTGGDKSDRIGPLHGWLRRYRLDEIPQLWNILIGDMSFVGPRPPLKIYTDGFRDIYDRVLKSRPGITGLATLVFHRHEERLLAQCNSPEETDRVYRTRCIPRKARLDLMYQYNQGFCFDMLLLWRTFVGVLKRKST